MKSLLQYAFLIVALPFLLVAIVAFALWDWIIEPPQPNACRKCGQQLPPSHHCANCDN